MVVCLYASVGSSVCALDREISELLLKAKASPDIRSLCIDEYHSKVCISNPM